MAASLAPPCHSALSPPPLRLAARHSPFRASSLPLHPRGMMRGAVRRAAQGVRAGVAEAGGEPAPMGQVTRYNDSFIDLALMGLFRRKMEQQIGEVATRKRGYEAFVEVSRRVMQGRSAAEQRAIVANVLVSLLPPNAPATFRKWFPPSKWSAEINAAITVPGFQWLVGPCQLKEVEVNGQKQMSGVQITKCRYLEVSGCVGMCVNMCKLPTQDFFTNDFGLPLTMTPNFENMSCEMVFGQMPPPLSEDPALSQPCFAALCSMAQPEADKCPRVPDATP
ncbi:unnamed protein product [Closterium sp. NIES-64]|nr:unnamed protein product [Closterium sp. NIES-65]CAI5971499.1 unnamed protein product [Closterium sp. NIES-64]CAI5989179.1 unnamed protein product [Closterium sp. NIES-65]